MLRRGALAVALTCVLAAGPTQSAALATPTATGVATVASRTGQPLPRVAVGRSAIASSDVAGVSTASANARIGSVLPGRTSSKVLGARFTMTVWDAASGSYVYQRRASASLRGASTTKVLTAVGVLATLGPGYRFPTSVRAGATPDEVVLVAGGDPLLTSADLRALAESTAAALGAGATPTDPAADARRIVVRADDSLFSGSGRAWGWRTSYLPREVRPVGAFARDDRKVRDATRDAARYFVTALTSAGVAARYGGRAAADPESATLATIAGHSVADSVSRMLLVSDNDVAEMLFRHIAVARGLPADWAGARQGLAATLRELQVPLDGVRIIDGSGLSLAGRLTAPALTSALNRALSPDHPNLAGLRGWLPVAGRTGTLRVADKRFSAKPAKCAAGRIQAKSGTVADAIALAGYATGADGQTKVFVAIVNSRPTRYSRQTTRRAIDEVASSVTGCW